LTITELPKPIRIDCLTPLHRRRELSPNHNKCVVCGRKTYRHIGNKSVCSYCSAKLDPEELGPAWDKKVILEEAENAIGN
jgi:ribosomal protein L37E